MLRISKSVFAAGGALLAFELLFFYLFQQYSALINSDAPLRAVSIAFPPALDGTAVFTFVGCLLLAFYLPADQSLNLGLLEILAATVIRFVMPLSIHDWRALIPADAHDASATLLVLMMLLFAGGLVLVVVSWIRLLLKTP